MTGAVLALALTIAPRAKAAAPYTQTAQSTGPGSGTNQIVILPAAPNEQQVIKNIDYRSATNTALLSLSSGTTVFTVMSTNILGATATTNYVSGTNGFVPGGWVVLNRAGTPYVAALAGLTGASNIVLASGGWGVSAQPGDNIYMMGTANTYPLGLGTNFLNPFYIGTAGRPVLIQLGPAGLTNYMRITSQSE